MGDRLRFQILSEGRYAYIPRVSLLVLRPRLCLNERFRRTRVVNGHHPLLTSALTRLFLHRTMAISRLLMDRNCFCQIRVFTLSVLSRDRLSSVLIYYNFSVNKSAFRTDRRKDTVPAFTESGRVFVHSHFFRHGQLGSAR